MCVCGVNECIDVCACVHAYVYVPVYIEPQDGCPVFFLSSLFLETGSLTDTEAHGF